jgi:hypothetical protein
MGEKSTWELVKLFFNSRYFEMVKRKDYLLSFNSSETLLDTYRCYLQRAGYLLGVKPGVYAVMRTIPDSLTLAKVQKEAYGRKRS